MNDENMFAEMQKEKQASQDANVEQDNRVIEALQQNTPSEENSVFDYTKLPDTPGKKYERVELNGQTVTIKHAEIQLPKTSDEWVKSRKGETFYKKCNFIVEFDTPNNDREYYSGVSVFKQDNGTTSNPSINVPKNKTQASQLFNKYKDYVVAKENITPEVFDEKYGLKHFMAFLNSNPKAVMKTEDVEFDDNITRKNFVDKFI